MNITTKRYPRTIDEAFPCDARRANAVEIYRRPWTKRHTAGTILLILLIAGITTVI